MTPNTAAREGPLLNRRYSLVKKLGEGEYGDVFLANDTLNENKLVALKREKRPEHFEKREGYNATMLREISVLQELGSGPYKHPCMV